MGKGSMENPDSSYCKSEKKLGFESSSLKESKLLEVLEAKMAAKDYKTTTIDVVVGVFRQFIEQSGVKTHYSAPEVKQFLEKKSQAGCSFKTIHNYYRFLKIVWDTMHWPWNLTPKDLPRKTKILKPFFIFGSHP